MQQVKMLHGYAERLEVEINHWLSYHCGVDIIDIQIVGVDGLHWAYIRYECGSGKAGHEMTEYRQLEC